MGEYKYVNKKLVGGKPKRIYKKQGSNKQYLKNNGKMMRVTEYRKKVSNKKKGGGMRGTKGTINNLVKIEIGTYQGIRHSNNPLDLKLKPKKKSLQIILKNENDNIIDSDDFTGFIDFSAIEIEPDGTTISANIILVIFQNNENKMLDNAIKLQKEYQKLDYYLSEIPNSDVLDDGTKYAVCSIDDVKYKGDTSIEPQRFQTISNDEIKSAFRTNLRNAKIDTNNTKVFYINNITFSNANCEQLQALIQTKKQVNPMLPKMATTTTNHWRKPFLKVMVPSIWYTSSIPLTIDEHKNLQFNLIKHLITKISHQSLNLANTLKVSSIYAGYSGVSSFTAALTLTGATGAFPMVFGPMLIVGAVGAFAYIANRRRQANQYEYKINNMKNMKNTMLPQQKPQSLQRQSPQQQFQRQSPQQPQRAPQQPFQRQSPQQQFQRAPQQPQRAPPQQQRAPQQPQRAPQQPQRAHQYQEQPGTKVLK